MHVFRTKDVERILGLSRGAAAALARRGFLTPRRARNREYEFSFQDLIVLRAAKSLSASRIPQQRIHRSLMRLRKQLPATMPLSGLSISASGDEIIVREGAAYWETRSGQYVLQFDVVSSGAALRIFDPPSLFEAALALEHDIDTAIAAYRQCLEHDPYCIEARINCGRLLHAQGALQAAEQMYLGSAHGTASAGARDRRAMLLFNLAVLLEDLERPDDARAMYHAALAEDSNLADAHYNLAVLSEQRGRQNEALRHFSRYRKLIRG